MPVPTAPLAVPVIGGTTRARVSADGTVVDGTVGTATVVDATVENATVGDRQVRFAHLLQLSTPTGLYEHALGTEPRPEHGMCVDDVARALVVTARVLQPDATATALLGTCLAFVRDAQCDGGLVHNRRSPGGRWLDQPCAQDHWGRALWALGTAASHLPPGPQATDALRGASEALAARSPYPRATAYAALGAVEVLHVDPGHDGALRMLRDARRTLPRSRTDPLAASRADRGTARRTGFRTSPGWPWPEDRLTYGNAVLPEAMIAVAEVLDDDDLLTDGLDLLMWLVAEQTVEGHLSVVPVGGRGPGDARPGFDQQPIEVTTVAEAAATALRVTGDDAWATVIDRCAAWFEGSNDTGMPVRDVVTGAGFDGLERTGVNQNRGAESTLAWLACAQLAEAPLTRTALTRTALAQAAPSRTVPSRTAAAS